jgi:hypothetical protein
MLLYVGREPLYFGFDVTLQSRDKNEQSGHKRMGIQPEMETAQYPREKIKTFLKEKRHSDALQMCLQFFAHDCYHAENINYLSRCLIESGMQSFDGNVTPIFLDALLLALRFGSVPEVAFSGFFSLYETFLKQRYQELKDSGKVVFVVGTGRNGSTSIAEALKKLPNSLVTHERPPIVFWKDAERQLSFHLRFIELSQKYFRFVVDAAHWWLPHIRYLKKILGDFDVIFLHRNVTDTVESFIRIKGAGRNSINHWTDHHGDYWTKHYWDKCYPDVVTFSEIGSCRSDFCMGMAKQVCIAKYVELYNDEAQRYVENEQGISLALETLFANESGERVFEFFDCEFDWRPMHLNKGGVQDLQQQAIFS